MSPVNDVEEATEKLVSLGWSVVLFIVAIIAALLSFSDLEHALVQGAIGLFLICLTLGIALLFVGRTPID